MPRWLSSTCPWQGVFLPNTHHIFCNQVSINYPLLLFLLLSIVRRSSTWTRAWASVSYKILLFVSAHRCTRHQALQGLGSQVHQTPGTAGPGLTGAPDTRHCRAWAHRCTRHQALQGLGSQVHQTPGTAGPGLRGAPDTCLSIVIWCSSALPQGYVISRLVKCLWWVNTDQRMCA